MRLFVAIKLPQETRESLIILQKKLQTSRADVKWVGVQNIHLTLKFLGEVTEKEAEGVNRVLEGVAAGLRPYRIGLTCVGAFPSVHCPRVIWVGISEGRKETAAVAAELEAQCVSLGFPAEERTFAAHITLGRRRSSLNSRQLVAALEEAHGQPVTPTAIPVESITLFKSTLSAHGPFYEALHEYTFNAS